MLFLLLSTVTLAAQAEPDGPAGAHQPSPTRLTARAFTDSVVARNASLEAMSQAIVAALEKVKTAGALADPMVSMSTAPRTIGSSMGVGADIEVSQALPWWGTLDARRAVARARAEAASDEFAALRLRLAALARGAFSDWVYVHRALDINGANQALLTELRNTARIRYSTGLAPQEDVLQADVDRVLLKQQRLELTQDEATVRARMNALLDRPPDTPLPPPAGLPQPVGLPAAAVLARRALAHPKLRTLAAEEHADAAEERLAEKERFPTFAVSAGYNSMWADPTLRPMVGLSITVPIDRGKYRADIDAAHAEARRAASTLEDQQASLLASLSADYAAVQEAKRSIALYRNELLPLATSTLDVARAEYASGRGDFLNVLTAEQHRLDAELRLARTQSEYFRALAELDRASGGGLLESRSAIITDPMP